MKPMTKCKLCGTKAKLLKSHIIPQFVSDTIKSNSPTGYLRESSNINMRRQDGDKLPLLCFDCEQRFSAAEGKFAKFAFNPFQDNAVPPISYGPWMNYFISSVNWRILYLDNRGFHAEGKYAHDELAILDGAERALADYLLGKRNDIGDIENHIFFFEGATDVSAELVPTEPNTFIRSSTFGYVLFILEHEAYYILCNLAGVFIFTLIRKQASDIWENTKVELKGGALSGPQRISSPLMNEIMELMKEQSRIKISEKQQKKLAADLAANPQKIQQSKALEFRERDRRLRPIEE